jgi:hypothetical protein
VEPSPSSLPPLAPLLAEAEAPAEAWALPSLLEALLEDDASADACPFESTDAEELADAEANEPRPDDSALAAALADADASLPAVITRAIERATVKITRKTILPLVFDTGFLEAVRARSCCCLPTSDLYNAVSEFLCMHSKIFFESLLGRVCNLGQFSD